jgi:hypothetical protein
MHFNLFEALHEIEKLNAKILDDKTLFEELHSTNQSLHRQIVTDRNIYKENLDILKNAVDDAKKEKKDIVKQVHHIIYI